MIEVINNLKNAEIIQKGLSKQTVEVIAIPNNTIVYPSYESGYNKEYCEQMRYDIAPIPRHGGTIVCFKDSVNYFSVGNKEFECNKAIYFLVNLVWFLRSKGITSAYMEDYTNDVMIDGFKTASFGLGDLGDGWFTTSIQVPVYLDLDEIKHICTKPMDKIPVALSEFSITSNEIENLIQNFFSNEQNWNKPLYQDILELVTKN